MKEEPHAYMEDRWIRIKQNEMEEPFIGGIGDP